MRVQHLAIDGASVTIEADADLDTKATATGWAVVPSLMRAHPFAVSPPGHSEIVENAVRSSIPGVKILSREEYSMKGGRLRVAEIRVGTATGGGRWLTVGAWEGKGGCITTSLVGLWSARLVEVFETLSFAERHEGIAIESPVVARPRTPEVIKEVPGLGVLGIRPAIASELELVPRSQGHAVDGGELFRIRATSTALLFVNRSVVARVDPLRAAEGSRMMAIARGLRIDWTPASRARESAGAAAATAR